MVQTARHPRVRGAKRRDKTFWRHRRQSGGTGGGGSIPTIPPDPDLVIDDSFLTSLPSEWDFARAGFQVFENNAGQLVTEPTAGTPVFSSIEGESRGVLIETASTNLHPDASDLSGASWQAPVNATLSIDSATAPDTSNNADTLQEDSTSSVHSISTTPFVAASGGIRTVSFYVPRSTTRRIVVDADAVMGASALFDIDSGQTVATAGAAGNLNTEIYPVGNFFRVILSGTGTGVSAPVTISLATTAHTTATPQTYLGDGASSISVWGYQLESRPFASGVIETLGSTGARQGTTLSRPHTLPVDEFSFVVDFSTAVDHNDDKGTTPRVVTFNSGAENESIEFFLARFNNNIIVEKTVGGVSRTLNLINEPMYERGDQLSLSVAVDSSGARASLNGMPVVITNAAQSTTFGAPFNSAPTQIEIGRRAGNAAISNIQASGLKVWHRALTDAELMAESAVT